MTRSIIEMLQVLSFQILDFLLQRDQFGNFIMVIFNFSVLGTWSRELYTIGNDFQKLIAEANKVPRFV
jgi:purine-cytosine permease-like protein